MTGDECDIVVHKWSIFLSVFEEADVHTDAGLVMAQRRENSWSYLSDLVKSVALHHVMTNCGVNCQMMWRNKIYCLHDTFCFD